MQNFQDVQRAATALRDAIQAAQGPLALPLGARRLDPKAAPDADAPVGIVLGTGLPWQKSCKTALLFPIPTCRVFLPPAWKGMRAHLYGGGLPAHAARTTPSGAMRLSSRGAVISMKGVPRQKSVWGCGLWR